MWDGCVWNVRTVTIAVPISLSIYDCSNAVSVVEPTLTKMFIV